MPFPKNLHQIISERLTHYRNVRVGNAKNADHLRFSQEVALILQNILDEYANEQLHPKERPPTSDAEYLMKVLRKAQLDDDNQ